MKFIQCATSSALLAGVLLTGSAIAQDLVSYPDRPFGLTVVNINNPIAPIVVTNADNSISITAGGGDTYNNPDSFTFAYQQITGDFDIKVRVISLFATEPKVQDSPKASLMARADLTPGSADIYVDALPTDADPNNPSDTDSGRHGQIETQARLIPGASTDDYPGVQKNYGGDTTDTYYSTYPDLWLRLQRQGNRFLTYFANTNPAAANFGTNGWNLIASTPAGTNFPATIYVGLSTVAHNSDITSSDIVTSTYASYGPTEHPSIPTQGGTAVPATEVPGPYPDTHVLAANWEMTLPADGIGFAAGDTTTPTPIIWGNGGYGSVNRDVLLALNDETPDGVSTARYQAGALDFLLSPRDPIGATNNLGPYSNPTRQRYGSGDPTVPASQAYSPNPAEGFVYSGIARNGAAWNDGSPAFHAMTYVQLDDSATGAGYDMISGEFKGGQFYTRVTKLVTGPLNDPSQDTWSLKRAAISHSTAWFPYQQGWVAGYIASVTSDYDANNPNWTPSQHWHRGNGHALFSGTAVDGPIATSYPYQVDVLTWLPVDSTPNYAGLADLHLYNVNSLTDGLLFTIANNENNNLRGTFANNAPKPDGSGWIVATRGVEEAKDDPTLYSDNSSNPDDTSRFSFLYVPFNSQNLIGGRINGTNASAYKAVGQFTLLRLSAGRYALTIPGKTGKDGMLMLQNSGFRPFNGTNVVDNSFFSYEYGATNAPANSFVIESRYILSNAGPDNLGDTPLRDADFNFVWVDFHNPLAPPALPPVATISISTISGGYSLTWTAPAGFVLQSASSLTGTWTTIPNATSPWTVTSSGAKTFYRVVQQ